MLAATLNSHKTKQVKTYTSIGWIQMTRSLSMVSELEKATREGLQPQGDYTPAGATDRQTPQSSTACPGIRGSCKSTWKVPELCFGRSEMASQGTEFTQQHELADSICAI